jgi:hypothetical protein
VILAEGFFMESGSEGEISSDVVVKVERVGAVRLCARV